MLCEMEGFLHKLKQQVIESSILYIIIQDFNRKAIVVIKKIKGHNRNK
jgi:hypothetical protein